MDDETKEKIQMAVALQALTSSVDTMKGQLSEMSASMKNFVLTKELEEAKRNFNNTIKQIRDGFEQHNRDDKASFGKLATQSDDLKKIILMAIGGGIVIVFILPFVIHYLFKV